MGVIFITKVQVNQAIRAKEVRLIGFDGQQLGVKTLHEALDIADSSGLDLVNVSPESSPPVCKIIDYGKFSFEQQKKDKINRSNQKIVTIKEIKLNPTIGDNDLDTKVRHAVKFLQDSSKVKLSIRFKGRAIVHQDGGRKLIEKFMLLCADFGEPEQQPKLDGRTLIAFLKPKK